MCRAWRTLDKRYGSRASVWYILYLCPDLHNSRFRLRTGTETLHASEKITCQSTVLSMAGTVMLRYIKNYFVEIIMNGHDFRVHTPTLTSKVPNVLINIQHSNKIYSLPWKKIINRQNVYNNFYISYSLAQDFVTKCNKINAHHWNIYTSPVFSPKTLIKSIKWCPKYPLWSSHKLMFWDWRTLQH